VFLDQSWSREAQSWLFSKDLKTVDDFVL
jgi:hypothetical protein